MSVTRRLMLSALCGVAFGGLGCPSIASAQFYEAARRSLDFAPDATARSPRLLGMGRLSLASDVHNRIGLWDFAASPTGVLEADTASSFDLWPSTSSADGRHRPVGSGRERGHLAGRELQLRYEGWRRAERTTAYGFHGELATLRTDRPFDESTELRGRFEVPRVGAVLNGKMPRFHTERMQYALQAFYAGETSTDEYRTILSNAEGDYLGRPSDQLAPPDFFTPEQFHVSTLGATGGVSYRFAPWLTAALAGGGSSSRIEGENSSLIHNGGTGEDRPYYIGQATLVGHIGGALEYGADGRIWTSSSEERWVFTLKAGINQEPFAGRGKKLDREESGDQTRLRLRWKLGNLEANAAAGRWRRDVEVGAPLAPDSANYDFTSAADRERYARDLEAYQGSFNYFLNVAANRDGADSLAIADSVMFDRSEQRAWDSAVGATWRLAGGRGLVGLEYHFGIQEQERTLSGEGPRRRTWDLRGGFEYACTRVLTGRLGYIYRFDDRDEFTARNELKSHTLTAGFGLAPRAAHWTFETGWALEWLEPDYVDATQLQESRQQLAAQLRWFF